jgi:hypothetical protein
MTLRLQRNRSAPSLADTANSPRQTAAAASAAAASAAAASAASAAGAAASAASAASATSAASAASGKPFAKSGRSGVFLVEDVECPQADVGDFFLTESDLGREGIPRRHIRGRHSGCCGCPARQRQGHTDNPNHRYGFLRIFSLRSTLRLRHSRVLPRLLANVQRPERYSYALPMHLARPITHTDWRSLHEADARWRRQGEQLFIRDANRARRALTNRAGAQRVPDFMNDIVAAAIMK